MQKGTTRHDRAQMRPVTRMVHQLLAARIVENVETGFY